MEKNIFFQYVAWFYVDRPKTIITAWRNYLVFNLNYFSIPVLIKTLFSPWRRITSKKPTIFNFSKFFESLTLNIISRTIGVIVRIFLIAIGIIIEIGIMVGGLIVLILWLISPIIFLFFFLFGFLTIINV